MPISKSKQDKSFTGFLYKDLLYSFSYFDPNEGGRIAVFCPDDCGSPF